LKDKPTREELKKRQDDANKEALASFPYERMETPGEQALAAWEILRTSRPDASAVVVGDDDALTRIVQGYTEWQGGPPRKPVEEILKVAGALRHPEDLMAKHSSDVARARVRAMELLRDKPNIPFPREIKLPPSLEAVLGGSGRVVSLEEMLAATVEDTGPELGEWPTESMGAPQLSVAIDMMSGLPLSKVELIVLPTEDWTAIPAYLNWGNWNGCPAPEYHVTALRSWRDRFGAELIGLSHDVMNIRVRRRPETREAALDLAREQYAYCSDIVEQGVGTLSALAAVLMESDWWYFWWD
jgi:Domain of unknown function (DUF4253)